MMSLRLVFALAFVSLAHGGITFLKAKSLSEVEKPARKADGQSDFWNPWNENPVVKQAEGETSRVWNAIWNNSWVRNVANQTEREATYAWNVAENNTVVKPMVQEVENTYSQLTNITSGNSTVPDVQHMKIHSWNVGALLCAVILLLCPAGFWGLFAFQMLEESREASDAEVDISVSYHPNLNCCYCWVSRLWNFGNTNLQKVLHQEVLLMLICPCLAFLAAPWTTCEEGTPSWTYLLYLPVIARSKWVERQLMLSRQVWGLIFVVFCTAAAAQQFLGALFGHVTSDEDYDTVDEPLLADLAAMHGLAELLEREDYEISVSAQVDNPDNAKTTRLLLVGLFKVALENIPQLLLQSSFLALVFDQLTPVGRAKVLFSILLGLASASQKIWEATRECVKLICRMKDKWDRDDWCFSSIISALFMLAPAFILWTVVKLYFVFHCETHLWNWGSGCVEWT
eukprot:Skav226884  [mRNA]  locus=scaffold1187:388174:390597:+ [translate_table: standard]